MAGPGLHGRDHLWGGADYKPYGPYEIKLADDLTAVASGDGKFIFAIPADLDQTKLRFANAYVTTVGSGATSINIRDVTQTTDLLSTVITIDASEFTSYTAATSVPTSTKVATGDLIAVDVDAVGAGSLGHGVILVFA